MEVAGLLAADAVFVDRINLDRDGVPGQLILAIVLAVYLSGLFGLSLVATRRVKTEEDFLVAGRRLGLFLCWGSLIATWFGAASMTGAAQVARDEGLIGTCLDPWASAATLIIAGVFYAPQLWRMKLLTTGDFFRRVYGPRAEWTCSAIQIPSYFGWIASQYMALGAVQQVYFGIPERVGIFLGFLIAMAYTMVGGMWSVTLTDSVQILIAFLGLVVLLVISFAAFGGGAFWDGVWRFVDAYSGPHADVLSLVPPSDATLVVVVGWISVWATGMLGNLPSQDLQQRMFAARSAATARNACVLAGVAYLVFGLVPVALGLLSRLEYPVETTVVRVKVLMYLAAKNFSVPLAVLFVVSFVSIVLSTATSAVLAPATILGHTFLGRIQAFRRSRLTLERVCVLIISVGGLALAYWGKSIFGLLDLALSLQLASLFVPLTMGLYGRPRGQLSAVLAAVLGFVFFAARYLPEEVIWTVPAAFSPRTAMLDEFEVRRGALLSLEQEWELAATPDARSAARAALDRQAAALLAEARANAEDGLRRELQTLALPPDRIESLLRERFDAGFSWVEYQQLCLSRERVGAGLHRLLFGFTTVPRMLLPGGSSSAPDRALGLMTISADLYGLAASFFGYFLGQWILKRRGCQWQPGALDPPVETGAELPVETDRLPGHGPGHEHDGEQTGT